MTLKTILFLIVINFLSLESHANLCESLFKPTSLSFEEFQSGKHSDKLLKAIPKINERLVKRYWDHQDVNFITENLILKLGGETNSFDLPIGAWIISRVLVLDNYLFLDLVHIQQKNIEEHTSIEVGKSSSSINSLFIKTLVAYIKAASILTFQHKEINTLVIRGVNIKNKMLLQLLEENGFQANNLHLYSKEREKVIELH